MLSVNLKRILGLVALILFIAPSSSLGAETVDRIVAVVNGEIVTLYDLKQRLKPHLKRIEAQTQNSISGQRLEKLRSETLKSIINEILLEQEASRLKINVSDSEVRNQIDQLKRERGLSEEEFQEQLQKEGMSRSEYEEKIRKKIRRHRLLGEMVRKKVVVTEEEIKEYYKNHKDKYRQDKSVRVSLLLLESKEKALSLRKDIAQGELSFARAAQKHSVGPGAKQGGDLGSLNWSDLGAKWKEALEGLEPREMSPVFDLQGKYAVLLLKSRKEGKEKPLEEVRDEIHDLLYKPKLEQRFKEYMQQLRSKAVIDIRL
jgi:peptidyl-prolyl cis-trans isomerase SurA